MDLVTRTRRTQPCRPQAEGRLIFWMVGEQAAAPQSQPPRSKKSLVLPEARICGFYKGVDWQFWGEAWRTAVHPSSLKTTCSF